MIFQLYMCELSCQTNISFYMKTCLKDNKQILTFTWKLVSKTLLTFFKEKSKGTLSLVSTERRQEWEAYFSLTHLIMLLVLHCCSLVCFSGHLFSITNKQTHQQICCNFFLWIVLTQIVFTIWNPRVQFLVLVLL